MQEHQVNNASLPGRLLAGAGKILLFLITILLMPLAGVLSLVRGLISSVLWPVDLTYEAVRKLLGGIRLLFSPENDHSISSKIALFLMVTPFVLPLIVVWLVAKLLRGLCITSERLVGWIRQPLTDFLMGNIVVILSLEPAAPPPLGNNLHVPPAAQEWPQGSSVDLLAGISATLLSIESSLAIHPVAQAVPSGQDRPPLAFVSFSGASYSLGAGRNGQASLSEPAAPPYQGR